MAKYQPPRLILPAGSTPPEKYVVARGGSQPVPLSGETFSAAVGKTKEEAAAGLPHGKLRYATVSAILKDGGTVQFAPEITRAGNTNPQHVNVQLRGPSPFGPLEENPVPKEQRIS